MYIFSKNKSRDRNRKRSARNRAKVKAKARRRINRMNGCRISARRAPRKKR